MAVLWDARCYSNCRSYPKGVSYVLLPRLEKSISELSRSAMLRQLERETRFPVRF